MKTICCLIALLIQVSVILGCAKPDHVDRINSPSHGLFFTIETNYAGGPAAADFTRIYAHLEVNGQSDKELVLDGQYLQNTKVLWLNSHEVRLCVSEGYTESFRNYVGLRAGGVSDTIHSHLDQHCSTK